MIQRVLVPAAFATAHIVIVALRVVGRSTPAIPPQHPGILTELAKYGAWPWMHAAAATLLVVTAWYGPRLARGDTIAAATWSTAWLLSASVMGSWGFLTLLWAIDTKPGASLVGPTLALCMSAATLAVFVERHARYTTDDR